MHRNHLCVMRSEIGSGSCPLPVSNLSILPPKTFLPDNALSPSWLLGLDGHCGRAASGNGGCGGGLGLGHCIVGWRVGWRVGRWHNGLLHSYLLNRSRRAAMQSVEVRCSPVRPQRGHVFFGRASSGFGGQSFQALLPFTLGWRLGITWCFIPLFYKMASSPTVRNPPQGAIPLLSPGDATALAGIGLAQGLFPGPGSPLAKLPSPGPQFERPERTLPRRRCRSRKYGAPETENQKTGARRPK